jgi:hypothetical protein
MAEKKTERGNYNIFKITNEKVGGKKKKRYYFVTGVYDDPDDVRTRIRGIAKSKYVRGGAKAIAGDMAKDGEDYDDHFKVTRIAKGLSKTKALEMRNRLKDKTPRQKTYNKPRADD